MSKQSKTNLTGWHRNTDLGCDLKTILCSDRRMKQGKDYQGVLRLDDEGTIDEYLSRDPHCVIRACTTVSSSLSPVAMMGASDLTSNL